MPDITMCKGDGCILRDKCFRYTAKPNPERQSYFANVPFRMESGVTKCDHFWETDREIKYPSYREWWRVNKERVLEQERIYHETKFRYEDTDL